MLQFLEQIVITLGSWTFVLVFVVLFFESSAFLGLILPGESLVMVTGALCGFSLLNLWAALFAVVAPVALGDCAGFLVGYYYGAALLSRWEFARRHYDRHRARLESWFQDWGVWTVAAGRFVSFGRAFTPFAAGVSKMPAARFMPMALASATAWSGGFFAAGYYFASNFDTLRHWAEFIGIGIFILIALTAGMALLWNWLSQRREQMIRAWEERVVEPVWARYGGTISRVAAFVRARLSPAGYLGLHITVGIVATVVLGFVFGSIAEGLIEREPIVHVDWTVYDFVAAHHTPVLDAVMGTLAAASNAWLLLAFTFAAGGWFLYRRMPMHTLMAALVFAGSWTLAIALEHLFSGAIPDLTWAGFLKRGETFPNLAMAQATAVYGLIWYAGVGEFENWRMQMLNAVAILYLIFLIGVATIYSSHTVSSVIGGFALGGCWLAICITAGRAWRRLRNYVMTSPAPPARAATGSRA